jgi:hypothetical protein
LRAPGIPKPNSIKFFGSIELIALLADPERLDEATKTISQYWKQKNARRKGANAKKNNEIETPDVCALGGCK